MIAHDLIDQIFSRPSQRISPDLCRITGEQREYLWALIQKDPEHDKVRPGGQGSLVWAPAGRYKYVLTEDLVGKKHTLARLSNIATPASASLFDF